MLNVDYIICPICKKEVKKITVQHMRMHGFSNTQEFLLKFPNQKLTCSSVIKKISNSSKCRKACLGKTWKLSEESKKKHSELLKGKEKSDEHKQNISKAKKGKKHTKEHIENAAKTRRNKKQSEKHKKNRIESFKNTWQKIKDSSRILERNRKLRVIRIEQMKKNGMKFSSYNEGSISFFQKFDKLNNTKGQYATFPYEYEIEYLGYFLDYINFDLKLIIEVDERHHFKKDGNLREKDIIRQKEIQKLYPDFEFLRFKDTEMDKILEIKEKELVNV